MIEVNSFFNGIYIYKFASREGYISKLEEFGASQDILDYADTLEEQYLGIVVGAVRQRKSLSEIQELVNKKKRVDELKSKTKSSIESEIPGHIRDSVKSWVIIQIKKFPDKKNLILSNLDRIDNSVQEYRIDLSSYDIDALLEYLNELEGKDSKLSSDDGVNNFLKKASEFAFKEFRKINNPKLIQWAKVKLINILKEWKVNLEKATESVPFEDLMAQAHQIKEDMDAGKFRGQEIPHTPLRHHEYDSLISNIEFLDDWEKAVSPDLFNLSLKDAIKNSNEWHKTVAESGIGLQYNPINRSNIVWENEEYFILELKDENDLKVEGSKQNHCVGGYGEKIKRKECRIFSLRAKNAVYSPILTIETDMSGAVVRQDYGPSNSRIDKKYHDMVTEWSTGNVLDVKTLSTQDKYKLIEKGDEKILAILAGDADNSVRYAVVEKTTDEKILKTLAGDAEYYIREAVAKKTTDENILAQLADDKNYKIRQAVAKKTTDENILKTLAGDARAPVRETVAEKTTDENILKTLAGDADASVRRAVAKKTTDEKILETLAGDVDSSIRQAVAQKTTDENILAQLADDEYSAVRQAVAANTTNTDTIIKLIMHDPYDLSVINALIKSNSNEIDYEEIFHSNALKKFLPWIMSNSPAISAKLTFDKELLLELLTHENDKVRSNAFLGLEENFGHDEDFLNLLSSHSDFKISSHAKKLLIYITEDEELLLELLNDPNKKIRENANLKLRQVRQSQWEGKKIASLVESVNLFCKIVQANFK